jgi:AcrR family transcriptional regulator
MKTTERIIRSAAEVVAKHGFHAATFKLVARHAEVNQITIFRTFKTKDDLLTVVLQRSLGAFQEMFHNASTGAYQAEETIGCSTAARVVLQSMTEAGEYASSTVEFMADMLEGSAGEHIEKRMKIQNRLLRVLGTTALSLARQQLFPDGTLWILRSPSNSPPNKKRRHYGSANAPSGKLQKRNGSSGRTRTYNPPVNSRMLCH